MKTILEWICRVSFWTALVMIAISIAIVAYHGFGGRSLLDCRPDYIAWVCNDGLPLRPVRTFIVNLPNLILLSPFILHAILFSTTAPMIEPTAFAAMVFVGIVLLLAAVHLVWIAMRTVLRAMYGDEA